MVASKTLQRRRGVRLLRFGLTGAIAAALIFVGLWTAAQLPIGPSYMIVDLFTTRGGNTTDGLREGAVYAGLIGFFAGALVDGVYEALYWLEHR